jgi:cytochrome c553
MTSMWRVTAVGVGVLLASVGAAAAAGPLEAPGYAKAFACSACHGFNGNSRSDTVPILAGMPAWYLRKAIDDYATGKRPAAEMESYAKMVKELGVDEVAGYFAAQTRQPAQLRGDSDSVARGRAASTPCADCHGPNGKGDAAKGVPDLTGQPAGYLRNQMLLFKADKRSPGDPRLTDLKAIMRHLPDATLGDLAAYYSSLR